MKLRSAVFCILTGLALTAYMARKVLADPPPGKGYVMVFDDEFNGNSLNTSKWNYNYPWGTYHNGEANMNSSEVTVANGVLNLQAENKRTIWNPWGFWSNDFNEYIPLDYTSGTINTDGKESWHYGYFEGRFKMPSAQSTWPAFWMLQNGWPPELDIFEVQHSRYNDYYTYHYSGSSAPASFGGVFNNGTDLSAGWHTYGVEWTPSHLSYYVDNQLVHSFYDPSAISQMQNMYLLIDLQVGGWAGTPNAADYPQKLQCDWVRVWQIGGPPSGVYRITPKNSPGSALDVAGYNTGNGASLDIWNASYGENQRFQVTRQQNGAYTIKAYPDWSWLNRVLDDAGWDTANGAGVDIWDSTGGDNQLWYFNDQGNGWYDISSRNAAINTGNNLALDIEGQSSAPGASLDLWSFWGGSNQLWKTDYPMTLTGVAVNGITDTGADIAWQTMPGATSEVDYGTTSAYGQSTGASIQTGSHSIQLTGLKPATTYHFQVKSVDGYGDVLTSSDQIFQTQAANTPYLQVIDPKASLDTSTGDLVVTFFLYNSGTAAARNVVLQRALLGKAQSALNLPVHAGDIAVGQQVQVTVRFSPAPASGMVMRLYLFAVRTGGALQQGLYLKIP